ncbi:uncharacterized protein LOC144631388 isoform X2 [Oculina patagonica]
MAISTPAANDVQDGEELYDDVAGVIPQDDYCEMDQGAEGNQSSPQAASEDTAGENYEVMDSAEQTNGTSQGGEAPGEDYMAMEDDTQVQEDYEEPQQENTAEQNYEIADSNITQPSAPQNEEYETPGADSDYEEADQSTSTDAAPVETDSMYEGVEPGESAVDGQRSEVNWDHLTKNTKPENIEGVIIAGSLRKLRKEGKIYVGSKWQKRYCVVRKHILYYFREKKSTKQAGHILLPGYKAQVANKKGREFTLTHSEGHRTFQFESNSKEETEKWIRAIQKACDAPLAERHSAYLDELRNKQPSGDEDSLHYADAGQAKNEADEEMNEDVYDDTNEDLYEVVGSTPSPAPTQQSQPIQEVDYEISAAAVSSTPAPAPAEPVQPIQEEEYELPEQTIPTSPPSPPPPRPTKSQPPQSPVDDTPPAPPPPRPSKPQIPVPPTPDQEEMYEIADTPDDTADLPPPPPPAIEEEEYEMPESAPAPPPMRPPKIPQPQAPLSSEAPKTEKQENLPERPARPGPKPQPPKRKDEPPQSPTEEQKNEINYANIYQALWNCDAGAEDELGFQRGDLIYIYEKPHPDWWIGSLFKPQGYSVGLVPKQYVMEAYELSA